MFCPSKLIRGMSRRVSAPTLRKGDDSCILYNIYKQYNSSNTHNLLRIDSFEEWLKVQRAMTKKWAVARNPNYLKFKKWMERNNGDKRTNLKWPDNFIAWLAGHRW